MSAYAYTRFMHTYDFFSSQSGPHHDLPELIERYKSAIFKRPIPNIQHQAFARIMTFFAARRRPLIIDSGCGTGMSTINLAKLHGDHDVIGIDKSADRLSRADTKDAPTNMLLVRADLIDLWRLLAHAQLPITHHYVLHPNPWPKIGQVKRRFYAHPVFASMLKIAPYLEVRTNWRIYAEELVMALKMYGQQPLITVKTDKCHLSLFEKKYLEAGMEIFVVTNNLAGDGLTIDHPPQ